MAAAISKDSLEELLQRGLDFYAMNRWEDAARCWTDALALDGSDPRAKEYLAALALEGHGPPVPPPPEEAPVRIERRESSPSGLREIIDQFAGGAAAPGGASFDKARFLALLRDRKLEEALDVLYRVRDVAPANASVSRAIQLLKDKLHGEHIAAIGHLGQVPTKAAAAAQLLAADLPTPSDNAVLRLVDGIATAEDILASSSAGPFSTARSLARLVEKGVLVMGGPTPPGKLLNLVSEAPPAEAPAPEAGGDAYEDLFREATHAYLRRDLGRALELFLRCQKERPEDRRVAHNIERLQQRMRST